MLGRLVRESGLVPADQTLAQATVYRLFRREGLMWHAGQPAEAKDRRRFAFRQADELWMRDVLDGPKLGNDRGDRRKRAKRYPVAFLFDSLAPHAAHWRAVVVTGSPDSGTFGADTTTFQPKGTSQRFSGNRHTYDRMRLLRAELDTL